MYRKFNAEQLFTGYSFLGADWVLVTDEAGKIIDLVKKEDAGDDLACFPGWLIPGMVNAHCHLELSHLKGVLPEHTGLWSFILGVLGNRAASPEVISAAMAEADAAMYRAGIVAVGDICNTADSLSQKMTSKIRYHSFVEVSGMDAAAANTRYEQARKVQDFFSEKHCATSLVPHAPYSVSDALFAMIHTNKQNTRLCMHNQETEAENEWFQHQTGSVRGLYETLKLPLPNYFISYPSSLHKTLPFFRTDAPLLLVHNVATSEADLEYVKKIRPVGQSETYLCICIGANKYISDTVPPVDKLFASGIPLLIGTDSLASNHQLSVYEEMEMIKENFPNISWTDLLQWATLNGARALGMDGDLGSFEKGKTPGVVQLYDKKILRLL